MAGAFDLHVLGMRKQIEHDGPRDGPPSKLATSRSSLAARWLNGLHEGNVSSMIKVLIAVDDTAESVEAAALARRLFGADAEYLAINVFEHAPTPSLPGSTPTAPMAWGAVWPYTPGRVEPAADSDVPELSELDVAEREARGTVERAGLEEAKLIGDVGDPARAILEAAHEYGVDVIVVGSHDRSWLSRLFSKSVSATVAKRADVPVLLAT
jgi:nucleotide-binding universal stress UspA family protein